MEDKNGAEAGMTCCLSAPGHGCKSGTRAPPPPPPRRKSPSSSPCLPFPVLALGKGGGATTKGFSFWHGTRRRRRRRCSCLVPLPHTGFVGKRRDLSNRKSLHKAPCILMQMVCVPSRMHIPRNGASKFYLDHPLLKRILFFVFFFEGILIREVYFGQRQPS